MRSSEVSCFSKPSWFYLSLELTKHTVDSIAGGQAAAAPGSVIEGQKIVDQALKAFGTVHILINNAGILRDKSLKNMNDQDFDLVMAVHLKAAYEMTHACWPIFRKQKYGRIINTTSAAGVHGNLGQANYSAAKHGLVGFTMTLAKEGVKYNITANAISPTAASAMTATVMPPDILKHLTPEFVAPVVGVLTAPNGPKITGRIFEAGAGYVAETRRQRSRGANFKPDESFTPSAVAARWNDITDFSQGSSYPDNMSEDDSGILKKSLAMSSNKSGPAIDFKGKTVIITGAGAGLGRAYALSFARWGANIVVNDVSKNNAQSVVDEITKAGGKAVAAPCSAEDGDAIVKVALDTFGAVHVLVANAGILRDKSFTGMSSAEWDAVLAVHLRGTYKCIKACWPVFQKQKFGRIVTTTSTVGLYGNFGQANYSTAKAGIVGLTKTAAIEGARYNIKANTIAPSAGTAMTKTIWPQEMVDMMKPDYIAPVVGYLASEQSPATGRIFEVYGGWAAEVRWERTKGFCFPNDTGLTPEQVLGQWDAITNFSGATHPMSIQESNEQVFKNFENSSKSGGASSGAGEDNEKVKAVKATETKAIEYTYTDTELLLYNLGCGAKANDLNLIFEGSQDFQVLPTFGVIPQFAAVTEIDYTKFLPDFNPAKLLHGEQYLKIVGELPSSGTLVTTGKILEVLDKGKSAHVTTKMTTKDKATGKVIFENQGTTVIRGSGGFGGQTKAGDRGAASALNTPPKRQPDAVVEEKTSEESAALYRLAGDRNPLHVDPEFSAIGGFKKPILHGLCSMGIAGKHILQSFGHFSDIKVRFAGFVLPGETLVTEMWKEGDKVIFREYFM